MIETAFYYSGFKRTLCGSKWDTYKSSWSSTSTARYGCCSANTYMSSPEGTGTFVEADSCSVCPVGTHVSLATSVPNDETSCMPANVYDKMPDGCKGKGEGVRSCYPRKAVDELIALNADGSGTHALFGPMKDWDMSLVTDLNYLFDSKNLLTADLSNWDVSRVTTMKSSALIINFNPFFYVVSFRFCIN